MLVSLEDAIFFYHPTAQQPIDFLLHNKNLGEGPYILEWNFKVNGVLVSQPTSEQLAAVTQEQVDALKLSIIQTEASKAALLSTNPVDMANRTDANLQWSRINDEAEITSYILDTIGINKDKFITDITNRRKAFLAIPGNKFEQTPTDPEVMYNQLVRLPQSYIVNIIIKAIQAGIGDPIILPPG